MPNRTCQMSFSFDKIVANARNGEGACSGCPAHLDSQGKFVNPGLVDPTGIRMFLTMDPRHYIDWSNYADWSEYNREKTRHFIEEWSGGKRLQNLLSRIPNITIEDIWLTDVIKCPVNNQRAGGLDIDGAFSHCVNHLREEITVINPELIVTMGEDPTNQLLHGIFDMQLSNLKSGTRDAGRIFDTKPPVVVSPHWGHGWLGRNNNREKVRSAILSVLS